MKHDNLQQPQHLTAFKQSQHRQPPRAAINRVREKFNAAKLIDICTRQDFSVYASKVTVGTDRFYWHQDNGSDILAVAHLDHVQKDASCTVTETAGGLLACSGALDDRLGAYVILDLLPKMGMKFDILLTTDEEMGRSTASEFYADKAYNWMIEFDRGGTDVVAYQYDTPELAALVEESGARMDIGSYSDIADLDHLECVGLNWGVGYEDYHGSRSHAWLEDTFRMVARFEKFHKANGKTYLEYDYNKYFDIIDAEVMDEWIVGDCCHEVNLADATTFVEDGPFINCRMCGLIP